MQRVRYYSARVSARIGDPGAPGRQQVYLDALKTLPTVTTHMGNFLVSKPWAGLVHPPKMKGDNVPSFISPYPRVVKIWKTEEKGSDVNLASHLLLDAFRNDFDVAAVLSNDTDLVEPIRIVKEELGLVVGIMCPSDQPSTSLAKVSSFVRHICLKHLQNSQFPDTIAGTSLTRPASWS